MMKGKADIYLIDSETGNVKQHVTEENLVTNAVQNVMTGIIEKLAVINKNQGGNYTSGIEKIFDTDKTLAESMFGGIMLFSKTLTENKEHCIPSSDEIMSLLGYASIVPSPLEASKMKGVYNSEESEITDTSIKFVYDFDSDKAVGDIASIALTSAAGGKYIPYETVPNGTVPACLFRHMNSRIMNTEGYFDFGSGYPCMHRKKADTGVYINGSSLYIISSGNLLEYDITYITSSGIGLFSNFAKGSSETKHKTTTPLKNSYSYLITDLTKKAVYGYDSTSNKTNLILNKVSGGGTEEKITIPMANLVASLTEYMSGLSSLSRNPLASNYKSTVVYNDKLYFVVGDINNATQETRPTKARIYELDFSGEVRYNDISTEAISLLYGSKVIGANNSLPDMSLRFVLVNDMVSIGYTSGTNALPVDITSLVVKSRISYVISGEGGTTQYNYNLATKCSSVLPFESIKEPWLVCIDPDNGMNYALAPQLYMCYLATINNLSSTITKGNTDKLKIVYTLTESRG